MSSDSDTLYLDMAKEMYAVFFEYWTQTLGHDKSTIAHTNVDFEEVKAPIEEWARTTIVHGPRINDTIGNQEWTKTGTFHIRIAIPENKGTERLITLGKQIEDLYAGQDISGIFFETASFTEEGLFESNDRNWYWGRIDAPFTYDFNIND